MKIVIIPDEQFAGITLGELKKKAIEHYTQRIAGKTVVNVHKGVSIHFSKSGLRHALHARNLGFVKVKALFIIDAIVKYAEFSNFNGPDRDDNAKTVFGYFNFKAKVKIEGKIQVFRIVVRLTREGKFYYDHSVKVKN